MSPDGTVELRYNTRTLRHIAEVKGQWLQPPHFRSPMDEALRLRVEAIEGPLPPADPRRAYASDSEDEDDGQFVTANDAFQSLPDFFNRRSRLERRDLYVCPRCFDVAARTIYRRPQPQPTPEAEAEAGAEVEPEEVEVEVEVAADNEASSSGGQCAAAAEAAIPDRCGEEEEEEEDEAEGSDTTDAQSSTSSSSSTSNSTNASSTEDEVESEAESVPSQEEWRRSSRLLFDERMRFSAAGNLAARQQAQGGGPDPRTCNPLKVLRALDGNQLHYCVFINARQWKAHLGRFHRDTDMLSREDHGLRQYIHAFVARNLRSVATIHQFWRRHLGYYAWLFNCIYDIVAEEGPEGALTNEAEAEGGSDGSDEDDEDDWLVADNYVSSSSGQSVPRPDRDTKRGRKRKAQGPPPRPAAPEGQASRRRLRRQAEDGSSGEEGVCWRDVPVPPAAVPAGAAVGNGPQRPVRQCRRAPVPKAQPRPRCPKPQACRPRVLSQSDDEAADRGPAPLPVQAAAGVGEPRVDAPASTGGPLPRRGRLRRNAPVSPHSDGLELCLG
eukprot:EG_transcript_7207